MNRLMQYFFLLFSSYSLLSQTQKLDSLLNIVENQHGDNQVKSYWLIVREMVKVDSTAASNNFSLLKEAVDENDNERNRAMLAHSNAYLEEFFGDIPTALDHYKNALFLFERSNEIKYAGEVTQDLTFVYGQLQENQLSLTYAKKATQLFSQSGDSLNLIGAFSNVGRLFHLKGELDSALIYLYRGIEVIDYFTPSPRMERKYYTNAANLYNNIGISYVNKEQLNEAIQFYKRALKIRIDQKDTVEIANMYLNIGGVDFENKNYLRARAYLDSASTIFDKKQHIPGVILCKTNSAAISNLMGEYSQAISYAKEGLQLSNEIADRSNEATNNIHLGRAYASNGSRLIAKEYFIKAIKIAKELNSKNLEAETYNAQYEALLKSDDYQQALESRNNYFNVKGEMFEENRSRDISELETKYSTRQKEQQIDLQSAQLSEQEAELQRNQILLAASFLALIFIISLGLLQRNRLKKKQQLKLQEAELRARAVEINATISSQEKERARYARDLHDGFGQMISVLNMNLKNLEDGAKPDERQKVFQESSKVIDEMYGELKNICFDLMPQTLIKHGLESALNEFSARINQTGKIFVELNIFGLEERLTELQEISLYRISQEWINNILKYSDAEKITLQITKDEGEITLLIEDNGSGFDKSLLEQGKGNGWKNLNTRAKLIQGELELETSPSQKGSVLIVNAPSLPFSVQEDASQNTVQTV